MGNILAANRFDNYRTLVRRVDQHLDRIRELFPHHMACRRGCDACCRPLTLFPIEAMKLAIAFSTLDESTKERVYEKIKTDPDVCPLLWESQCLLYADRPIICRTHGFPICFRETNEEIRVDFCPENFKGIASFPNETLLDIDALNTLLAVVNRHFLGSMAEPGFFPERMSVSEALRIELK